jgi:Origin of replication binding protein
MSQPAEVTLEEALDPRGIQWLRDNPAVVDRCDRRRRNKLERKRASEGLTVVEEQYLEGPSLRVQLDEYFRTHDRDGHVKVKYHYPRDSGMGRRYVHTTGLQRLMHTIREVLTWWDCCDVDMVNAHFVIYCHMCQKHGIPCPVAQSYVDDREVHVNRLKEVCRADRKVVKPVPLKVLNGGGTSFTNSAGAKEYINDPWLTELKTECRANHKLLCALPAFAAEVECKKDEGYNAEAKAINLAICKVENQCLQYLVEYAALLFLVVLALFFDGLMLRSALPEGFLVNAQAYVLEKSGYDIPLDQKPIPEPDWEGLIAEAAADEEAIAAAAAEAAAEAAAAGRVLGQINDSFKDFINKWFSVCAGMNSGKTFRTVEFLLGLPPDKSVLFITPRRAQAYTTHNRCLVKGLPFTLYLDCDTRDGKLKDKRQVVEYESLWRLDIRNMHFDVVILDEMRSLCRTMQCIGTNRDNLMKNWNILQELTAHAEKTLFLDADMLHDGAAYETMKFLHAKAAPLEIERGIHAPILFKEYEAPAMQRGIMLATNNQIWKMIEQDLCTVLPHEHANDWPDDAEEDVMDTEASRGNTRIMIVCGSVKEANAVTKLLSKLISPSKIGLYTGESTEEMRKEVRNLEETWLKYRVIIFTSMLTAGADFNGCMYRAYILPHKGTTTPQEAHQQGGRPRRLYHFLIVVRWDSKEPIRTVTRREVDRVVEDEKGKLVERDGLVERTIQGEQFKLCLTIEGMYVGGRMKKTCSGMASLVAYANAEQRYTRSDGEWMAYFLYIARQKRYSIEFCTLQLDAVEDAQLKLMAKGAIEDEVIRREVQFDQIDMSRVPMYSVKELAKAREQVQAMGAEQLAAAEAKLVESSVPYVSIQIRANMKDFEMSALAEKELELDAESREQMTEAMQDPDQNKLLTYQELELRAVRLRDVLRFERTRHGVKKDMFMQRERQMTGQDFGEHELKLLCSKARMMLLFPPAYITLKFTQKYLRKYKTLRNHLRLRDDLGNVDIASAVDFLKQAHASDTPGLDYHPHMVTEPALKIVRALGFTSVFDFETKVPLSAITQEKVQPYLLQLHTLNVFSCKSDARLKTKVSAALAGAIGVKLRTLGRLGKRKREQGEVYLKLELAPEIEDFLDIPNELSSEHWYKAIYREPAPHLDQYKVSMESTLEELMNTYNTYIGSSRHTEYCLDIKQLIERKGGSVRWV